MQTEQRELAKAVNGPNTINDIEMLYAHIIIEIVGAPHKNGKNDIKTLIITQ
jgi:hypothetical protein